MDKMKEDVHLPGPVGDSMIPFPPSQLTSLRWWQAAAQVSETVHDCLLHPLRVVMLVTRETWYAS